MPGHEFTGIVSEVGGFAPGDPVAVGNIVDSCGTCPMCRAGQENFCRDVPTLNHSGRDRQDGATTLGGYSREYVVGEDSPITCLRASTRPRHRFVLDMAGLD